MRDTTETLHFVQSCLTPFFDPSSSLFIEHHRKTIENHRKNMKKPFRKVFDSFWPPFWAPQIFDPSVPMEGQGVDRSVVPREHRPQARPTGRAHLGCWREVIRKTQGVGVLLNGFIYFMVPYGLTYGIFFGIYSWFEWMFRDVWMDFSQLEDHLLDFPLDFSWEKPPGFDESGPFRSIRRPCQCQGALWSTNGLWAPSRD